MLSDVEKQHNRESYRKRMALRDKKLIIFLLALPLLIFSGRFMWGVIGVNIPYSEGERTVKIIKVAKTGVFWKTWEAEGVLTQDNFAVTYLWKFSVDNNEVDKEKLINEIKTAFENGQTVKIRYDQRVGSVPWRS
ncbi:hypothetical protein A3C23_01980 [Candidatus Roizmanbacteria bacterium RIFCSPHIGHO2_02_FULL_37_13b]|uniref:Uncharacterized protein n=1 Tax=Candidatus Roizmanbacteria bacterium RIFCSPLOWO2_02_FULL_36_11 TaxID=1802071 RepID=A0A1F7JBN4_9BACT|nr:MAG: hypothetical protein A3C23_01980 [Candidatus Roizmanbacteria bacterium RIFCSPHIGHO2_02_FULL_37_13b]OGK53020.1 MAG: hypothetical protein A3H78_02300 [Candidatus Roizmanbacteria bacterium RIFCSPLOWO2_02_FULL_36_11]